MGAGSWWGLLGSEQPKITIETKDSTKDNKKAIDDQLDNYYLVPEETRQSQKPKKVYNHKRKLSTKAKDLISLPKKEENKQHQNLKPNK